MVWQPLAPDVDDTQLVLVAPDGQFNFLPGRLARPQQTRCVLDRAAGRSLPSAQAAKSSSWRGDRSSRHPTGSWPWAGSITTTPRPADPTPDRPTSPHNHRRRHADRPRRRLRRQHHRHFSHCRAPYPRSTTSPTCSAAPAEGRPSSCPGQRRAKEAIRADLPGHRYIHLATHGYFAPESINAANPFNLSALSVESAGRVGRAEVRGFYPGLVAGLAWAGANVPVSGPMQLVALDVGAGVITAEEVEGSTCRL